MTFNVQIEVMDDSAWADEPLLARLKNSEDPEEEFAELLWRRIQNKVPYVTIHAVTREQGK